MNRSVKMSLKIDEKKDYLCAICKTNRISEKRVCELFEGSGSSFDGDIHGFDPNTYTNYRMEGGRLLAKRPDQHWNSDIKTKLNKLLNKPEKEPPIGGICIQCLENPVVLSLMEHIQFKSKSR